MSTVIFQVMKMLGQDLPSQLVSDGADQELIPPSNVIFWVSSLKASLWIETGLDLHTRKQRVTHYMRTENMRRYIYLISLLAQVI